MEDGNATDLHRISCSFHHNLSGDSGTSVLSLTYQALPAVSYVIHINTL